MGKCEFILRPKNVFVQAILNLQLSIINAKKSEGFKAKNTRAGGFEMTEFLPAGTYRSQGRDIRSTLYCMARKRNGDWIPASLDLTYLEEANVANEDGHLVNLNGDVGQQGFVPEGSYLHSTKDRQVILSALCQRDDQVWQWSTIEITYLEYADTLSLVDGVLVRDDSFTN
jgi:hypothetical protein